MSRPRSRSSPWSRRIRDSMVERDVSSSTSAGLRVGSRTCTWCRPTSDRDACAESIANIRPVRVLGVDRGELRSRATLRTLEFARFVFDSLDHERRRTPRDSRRMSDSPRQLAISRGRIERETWDQWNRRSRTASTNSAEIEVLEVCSALSRPRSVVSGGYQSLSNLRSR